VVSSIVDIGPSRMHHWISSDIIGYHLDSIWEIIWEILGNHWDIMISNLSIMMYRLDIMISKLDIIVHHEIPMISQDFPNYFLNDIEMISMDVR
jgi:hypothetical protein